MHARLKNSGEPTLLPTGKKEFSLNSNWQMILNQENWFIPQGFQTDLASIPAFIFYFQWGLWNFTAIAHDHIYQYGFLYLNDATNSDQTIVTFTRKQADQLFYDLNLGLGVNRILAYLMFVAVRLFGGKPWQLARK